MTPRFLLIFSSVLQSVQLFGVELNCPAFKEGLNEIVCRINKTEISHAGCLEDPKLVTFDHTPRNNSQTTLCTACNPCDRANDPPPQHCCCDDSDPEIKTCKFSYVSIRSYDEGARLQCKYCIDPQKPLDVRDESCRNIRFASSGGKAMTGTPTWLIGVTFYIVCELIRYDW